MNCINFAQIGERAPSPITPQIAIELACLSVKGWLNQLLTEKSRGQMEDSDAPIPRLLMSKAGLAKPDQSTTTVSTSKMTIPEIESLSFQLVLILSNAIANLLTVETRQNIVRKIVASFLSQIPVITAQEALHTDCETMAPRKINIMRQSSLSTLTLATTLRLLSSVYYFLKVSGEGSSRQSGAITPMMPEMTKYALIWIRLTIIGDIIPPMLITPFMNISQNSRFSFVEMTMMLRFIDISRRKQAMEPMKTQRPWQKGVADHMKNKFVITMSTLERARN